METFRNGSRGTGDRSLGRRDFLKVTGASAAAMAGGIVGASSAYAAEGDSELIAIVVDGEARAVIVRQADADETVLDACEHIQRWVRQATGVKLPVISYEDYKKDTARWPENLVAVGFVPDEAATDTRELIEGFDEDGFAIVGAENTVTILGASSWGTWFGATEFLERYAGIRWLLPGDGPEGTHVPSLTTLAVPTEEVASQPAILSRNLRGSGLEGGADLDPLPWGSDDKWTQFAVRNRARARIGPPGHRMRLVFPRATYADPNKPETYRPDFYPIINGEVRLPTSASDQQWQPRFSNPDTVPVAIEYVINFFDQNPNLQTVRFGINDSQNFSETDYASDGRLNSNYLPDCSEAYYGWLNAVVSGVLDERPDLADKTVTVLAYKNVLEAPSFPLHPNIVPYIARDQYGWVDDEWREQEQKSLDRWGQVCENLANFDYNYGRPYHIPRVYVEARTDILRYAHDRGLKHIRNDGIRSDLGEGPKTWIYTKQMWDPDLDPNALLNDWCRAAVGESGAAHLKRAFAVWEQVWSKKVPQTPWFDWGGWRDYFFFLYGGYAEAFHPDDAQQVRHHLEQARDKTITDAQRLRAELMLRRFEYHEAIINSYPHRAAEPHHEGDAVTFVRHTRDQLDYRVGQVAAARRLYTELDADPLTANQEPVPIARTLYLWTGYDGDTFWHLVDYLTQERRGYKTVLRQLERLAENEGKPKASQFARFVLRTAANELPNLAVNASFEQPFDAQVPGAPAAQIWNLADSLPTREPDAGRTGSYAARIPTPASRSILFQTLPAGPGLVAARVHLRSSANKITHGTAGIFLSALHADGSNATHFHRGLNWVRQRSAWSWISAMEEFPDDLNQQPPGRATVYVQAFNHDADGPLDVDDVTVVTDAELPPYAGYVTASSSFGPYAPQNTLDGNFDSAWSVNQAGEWLQYDLGLAETVQSVSIAWNRDDRSDSFDIAVSTDGQTWTNVFSGASSGEHREFENYAFPSVTARHVRIVNRGNSHGTAWIGITEVRIHHNEGTWPDSLG